MGGRGASFGTEIISATSGGDSPGKVIPLNVAGMSPTDYGSRYTDTSKTLVFIESKKINYGKEQLQIIDDYGYVTKAFQGNAHSVTYDDKAIKYMKDKVVTHNHPSSYGGTFSEADIQSLAHGMRELRASAKEGTYIIRRSTTKEPMADDLHRAYMKDAPKIQEQMRKIAFDISSKKWSSQSQFRYENRKAQVDLIHNWYVENMNKYGFEYTFEPRKDK